MTRPTLMMLDAVQAALAAGRELGLFEALRDQPATAEALADRLGLAPGPLRRALEVLRTQQFLVEGPAGAYAPAPGLLAELAGPAADRALSQAVWAHLPTHLRTGEVAPLGARGATYSSVVPRLAQLFERVAGVLASRLAPCLPPDAAILDVGAGSGVWSLALGAVLPGASVTALDLPPVIAAFERRAESLGLRERIRALPGDYHHTELPAAGFDAIVLANVVHLEGPEPARALIRRCGAALRPRGRIVVVDMIGRDEPHARAAHAAYALHLGLRLAGGYPHAEPDLRAWLGEAGCPIAMRIELGEELGPMAALVATP